MKNEFSEIYEELRKYKTKFGNVKIPRNYEIDGLKLGHWLQNKRMSVINGTSSLSNQEIDQLKYLGVDFSKRYKDRVVRSDKDYLIAFKKYFDREQHLNVPKNYLENGLNLNYKISHYKRKYSEDNLSEEVINFFENIPDWSWDMNFNYARKISFVDGAKLVKEFQKQNGHLRIPRKKLINGVNLAYWIGTQIQKYKKGELEDFKIKELESIPMWKWHRKKYTEFRKDLPSQSKQKNKQIVTYIFWNRAKKLISRIINFFKNFSRDFSSEDKFSEQKYRGNDHEEWSKKIKEIYNFKCCITGIQTESLLESSHIVGWAKDKTTRLDYRNGLCLSKLVHSCFDNGIITIDENYLVNISNTIKDDKILLNYLQKFEGKKINLPEIPEYIPLQSYFKRHSESFHYD
tara:strand:+ start:51 stop:1259 length:1209 start_codon:yes stop_codon:yes gene_type:complete